jgi:hypothetical protein
MASLLQAITGTTSTTSTKSTDATTALAESPGTDTSATTTAGVSATDQFKAMQAQSGLQSFLSSSIGSAVLQLQTASSASTVDNYASSLVTKAVAEYRKNAEAVSTTATTAKATAKTS